MRRKCLLKENNILEVPIMSIKVAINGFGRIGRLALRAGLEMGELEFVGINNPGRTPELMA